jgi:hypothetical protein
VTLNKIKLFPTKELNYLPSGFNENIHLCISVGTCTHASILIRYHNQNVGVMMLFIQYCLMVLCMYYKYTILYNES